VNLLRRVEKLETALVPSACTCPRLAIRCVQGGEGVFMCTEAGPVPPPVCPVHGESPLREFIISGLEPSPSGPIKVSEFRHCAHGTHILLGRTSSDTESPTQGV